MVVGGARVVAGGDGLAPIEVEVAVQVHSDAQGVWGRGSILEIEASLKLENVFCVMYFVNRVMIFILKQNII